MSSVISQLGKFTDCDEWCESAAGWDLHFQQLDRGRLDAVMKRALTADLVVQHVSLSRRFHQAGDPPDGLLSFGIPGDHRHVHWFDRGKFQAGMMNFNRRNGFDCVSEPGFTAHTFSVLSAPYFDDCRALGATDDEIAILEHQGLVGLSDEDSRKLARLGSALMQLADDGASEARVTELVSDIRYLLAMALIGADRSAGYRAKALRQRAVDKALEAIQAKDGLVSVLDVCSCAATSARSLSRGFQERFGISTKQYMVATRLSAARRELLSGATSVTEAASDYGFWHLGRFSSDYRGMFGELPSQTLTVSRGPAKQK